MYNKDDFTCPRCKSIMKVLLRCDKCGEISTWFPGDGMECGKCESGKASHLTKNEVVEVFANSDKAGVEKLRFDPDFWMKKYGQLDNESHEDYVKMVDHVKPFGIDKYGKAYLFPTWKKSDQVASRLDMAYRSDWGDLRTTGIGWKLNPTLFIAMIFFLPDMIITPILYVILGGPGLLLPGLLRHVLTGAPFLVIVIYFTELISYCQRKLDELTRPYGVHRDAIRQLFTDDLTFLKWGKKLSNDVANYKFLYIGMVGFVIIQAVFTIPMIIDPSLHVSSLLYPLGNWSAIFGVLFFIGLGLILFLVLTFFVAVVYGLFRLGKLSFPVKLPPPPKNNLYYKNSRREQIKKERKHEFLSINKYANMLRIVTDKINLLHSERKKKSLGSEDPVRPR
ncbi:MAG: hypothetical protein ACTSUE_27480 [Promethearchaeota archaeon]